MSADLLKRASKEGAPLIDGERVTFLWAGEQAPLLVADFGDWEYNPISLQQTAPGIWTHRASFPRDAYLEYGYIDPQSEERVPDPLNPQTVPNGLGDINHFFYMPEARPSSLTRRARGIRKGTLTRHTLQAEYMLVGHRRKVYLYQPPTDEPCPLVVVYDGNDYLRRGKLLPIVDNLIAQKRIRPIALAMIANYPPARSLEYGSNDTTLGMVVSRLIPLAEKELNLLGLDEHPGAYTVMGASMSGMMALYSGLRAPGVFGQVLAQSGAYRMDSFAFVVNDLARYAPKAPVRIWMDVGEFEFLLEANREMHDLLCARGYQVGYREYPGGHNYTSWRNDLWRGLETLFGPGSAGESGSSP